MNFEMIERHAVPNVHCPVCGAPDLTEERWLKCLYVPGTPNLKDYLGYECTHCGYHWNEETYPNRWATFKVYLEEKNAKYREEHQRRGMLDLAPPRGDQGQGASA